MGGAQHVQGPNYSMLLQRFGYPFSVRKIVIRSTICRNYPTVGIAPPYLNVGQTPHYIITRHTRSAI